VSAAGVRNSLGRDSDYRRIEAVDTASNAEGEIRHALATVRGALRAGWKRIVLTALLGGVLTAALSFAVPPSYVSHVLLLPMEQSPTAALRGIASSLADLYLGSTGGTDLSRALPDIVNSRTYLERLLNEHVGDSRGRSQPLLEAIDARGSGDVRMARAAKKLARRLDLSIDRRTGTISLRARFEDPRTASDIANSGAVILQNVVNDVFTSQASQERRFLEERIVETEKRLRDGENELTAFRTRNVRVGAPHLVLEESRLARAVREQEQVYLTLREQYELARINETRRIPSIRIVDRAVPPVEHDWPPRRLFAMAGTALGGLVAMIWAVRRQRALSLAAPAPASAQGA
jgi:uncharacterized protein involved in exopolysaccharide biosynthesis